VILDLEASFIFYRDYVQGIYISMFYYIYIYRALLYELKNRGLFSVLDEELWVYMNLNIKAYDSYSLIAL
jgi:hypothetical protein